MSGIDTRQILNRLLDHQHLNRDEASALMDTIMSGDVGAARTAAILTALRMKGETIDEVVGFVRAMREKALRVATSRDDLVDTCGTGGDGQHTINISTAAALVAAGMDIGIAKHGNRAVSSKCGSTDVLEALGVNVDLTPQQVADIIDRVGIGFLFAPRHHPAMRHVAPVRRELGVRTVFNLLGPMTNPAGVRRQLLGVFRPELTELVAHVLAELGAERVSVVHGLDGTDELSIGAPTRVSMLTNGSVRTVTVTPEDAGLESCDTAAIRGGDASENAGHILDILRGKRGPMRDAVVLNAACVAMVAGRAEDLREGAELAMEAIDSGAVMARLEALRAHTAARGGGERSE